VINSLEWIFPTTGRTGMPHESPLLSFRAELFSAGFTRNGMQGQLGEALPAW
jgi:hypothetical protein